MATLSSYRRNGLGLLFLLSALVQSAAGCSDEPAQPASPREQAHDEIPSGAVGDDDAAPAAISVRGTVLDMGRSPLAGVPVLIGDHPLALTDTSGQFTVPNVSPPYTVTVLLGTSKTVVIYEGLSRPDPTIVAGDPTAQPRQAGIQGTLAGGGGYPEAALTRTSVQLAAAALFASTPEYSQAGGNTFILPPQCNLWTGPATIHGTLHALQYTHKAANDFKPIDYKGYGTLTNVAITEGDNEVAKQITLGPIGKVSFSASVTAPADYAVTQKRLRLTVGGQVAIDLPKETQPSPDIHYPLPAIGDAKVRVVVSAENATTGAVSTTTKNELPLDAANATIGILPSPTLVLPVDKATGVTMNTPFSWTKLDGGVHVFVLIAGPSNPHYQIVTAATEARLPDLASAGIQPPPGTTYNWAVVAVAPFASVDAYAGDDVADRNALPVLYEAQSSLRSFTTAP